MQIIRVEQGSEEWHELRLGKVSGSRLGDIWAARQYTKEDIARVLESRGHVFKKSAPKAELEELLTAEDKAMLQALTPKKIGFYELLAERLALPHDGEDVMDRGLRLEQEAIDRFTAETGKQVERVGICVSDRHSSIINSPDGLIKHGKKYTEAVEIKCLASARHLQAVIEKRVPDEYEMQKLQYFVVNEELEQLNFIFYDPRIASVPYYHIEITRESLGAWPQIVLEYQLQQLKEIDELVVRLGF